MRTVIRLREPAAVDPGTALLSRSKKRPACPESTSLSPALLLTHTNIMAVVEPVKEDPRVDTVEVRTPVHLG